MKKVFIDGSEGTTGLRIFERFEGRDDIEILKIPSEFRKDSDEIKKYINASDITFLCLPDAAAREAAAMVENESTIIIDTSTAHRTEEGWAYGYPAVMRPDLSQSPIPWLPKRCFQRIIRWRHLQCPDTAGREKRQSLSTRRTSGIVSLTRQENTRLPKITSI